MKKMTHTFAVAMSAALISGVASADANPFGVTELPVSSYLQLAEAEMACGANMKMDAPKAAAENAVADKKAEAKAAETKAKDATKATVPTPTIPTLPKH